MKTRTKTLLGITIALVALLIVAYFGMGYVIYDTLGNVAGSCDKHLANRPDQFVVAQFAVDEGWPADFDVTPYFMSPYESVRFPSRDGKIQIAGWWIPAVPANPAAPAVILLDGLGGCKNSISVLTPAGMLWHNGFNVLLIDVRDTGESTIDDLRSTIGNDEYRDVLGAWDWLVNEKGFAQGQVGLFANSLGGAMANYAFAEEPRIAALFLQGTFGDLQQIIRAELKRNGYPTWLAPSALAMGSLITGENLFARSPMTEIQRAAGRPVFILHAQGDTRISTEQSKQLAAVAQAAGVKVTAWFPAGGDHMTTPAVHTQEFEQRLVGFFREALKARPPSISADEMQWETTGGGQITFSVVRNGEAYDVHVTAYQFKDRDDRFTITAEAGQVYKAISALMQDQGRIKVNAPGGPPTGSWTTLRFSDGEHTGTFKDVVLDDDLRSIYNDVTARIGP